VASQFFDIPDNPLALTTVVYIGKGGTNLGAISTLASSAPHPARAVTNIAFEKVATIATRPEPCVDLPELRQRYRKDLCRSLVSAS